MGKPARRKNVGLLIGFGLLALIATGAGAVALALLIPLGIWLQLKGPVRYRPGKIFGAAPSAHQWQQLFVPALAALPAVWGLSALGAALSPIPIPDLDVSPEVLALLAIGVSPALEEMIFRGYLLAAATGQTAARTAILLQSILYGLINIPAGGLGAFLFAVIAGMLTVRSKGLWLAIALHTVLNIVLFIQDQLVPAEHEWNQLPLVLVWSLVLTVAGLPGLLRQYREFKRI